MTTSSALVCAECGRLSPPDARGWRAYLGGGVDDEPEEAFTFCPECAECEFGGDDAE